MQAYEIRRCQQIDENKKTEEGEDGEKKDGSKRIGKVGAKVATCVSCYLRVQMRVTGCQCSRVLKHDGTLSTAALSRFAICFDSHVLPLLLHPSYCYFLVVSSQTNPQAKVISSKKESAVNRCSLYASKCAMVIG